MQLAFTVPGKPVGKERSRSTASGHHFTPAKTRAYEHAVYVLARMSTPDEWPMTGEYAVTIRVWYGDKRRRDVDNNAKALLDGMNGAAYVDDSQVSELHVYRGYDKANPRCEVTVTAGIAG